MGTWHDRKHTIQRRIDQKFTAEGLAEWLTPDNPPVWQAALDAQYALVAAGIDGAADVCPLDPAGALLLAEACNLAAKIIDEGFYDLKPWAIVAARALGCDGGWGDDGAYYLYAPGVGTAAFHGDVPLTDSWPHPWSGVRRQDLAIIALSSPVVRSLLAAATDPKPWLDADAFYDHVARLIA